MCKDNFENGFTPEEVSKIGKRVLESPSPKQEQDFIKFFERLRKKSELYSLIMFQGLKLLHFDKKARFVIIRDQSGSEVKIDLT